MFYFSAKTNGFYDPAIHGKNIPDDAVGLSEEQHTALIEGQASGKIITADENGFPILVDPPAPDPKIAIQAQINAMEASQMMPRATREFMIYTSEALAAQQGISAAELYERNIGYRKVKDFDNQIKDLRALLAQ